MVSTLKMNRVLLTVPDKRLREVSRPLEDPCCSYARELAEYMLSQLEALYALGIAAPQFGELSRVFVARLQGIEIVLVNPKIAKTRGEHVVAENCMSIPGRVFMVRRPKIVRVTGFGLDGQMRSVRGRDLLAQILCHEIGHLEGVLIDEIGRAIQ